MQHKFNRYRTYINHLISLFTVSDNYCLRYQILLVDAVVFKRHQRYQYVSQVRSQWCIQQWVVDLLDGSGSKVSTTRVISECVYHTCDTVAKCIIKRHFCER